MEQMSIGALIGLETMTAAAIIILGFGYALLIYYRPFPVEWTSVSVIIGVILTEIPAWFAIYLILVYFGLAHLWWLPLITAGAYLVTGGPQFLVERMKHKRNDEKNNRILKRLEDDA